MYQKLKLVNELAKLIFSSSTHANLLLKMSAVTRGQFDLYDVELFARV